MDLLLAFETSCDETAVAVVTGEKAPHVVAEKVLSQTDLHKLYGGVVPELASREHLKALPLLTEEALLRAGATITDIEAVAVTRGPGLKGCLLMGIGFAKGVATARGIPLIGVNHIEGHILSPFIENPELPFPYLAVVVSGGHTEILAIRGLGAYELLARTMDDAAGEAFDKSANLLGFEYPGGPKLATLADSVSTSRFNLPRVMRESESAFSFSGLKTAIALLVKKHRSELADPVIRAELSHAVQGAIIDALMHKVKHAVTTSKITNVALCGGVAANAALRAAVQKLPKVKLFSPATQHCADNAAMIGYAGALRWKRGDADSLSLDALPRWPVEECR